MPIEAVGDVRFVSSAPMPTPGTSAAVVAYVNTLLGSGSVTFEGGWRVDEFNHTGDIVVAPNSSLAAFLNGAAVRSFHGSGLIDLGGTIASSQPIDLLDGILDLGRNDLTVGAPVAGAINVQGDLALGGWQIGGEGYTTDRRSDRIDVTGTLDLTQSRLLTTSYIKANLFGAEEPPPYLVLASYGTRIGSLDASTITVTIWFDGPSGTYPIVYTSAENAGPGEIRVLLPEPSILLTGGFAALLVRRRREQ